MKYKIGVYGSAAGDMEKAVPAARKLAEALSKYKDKIIVINGACAGLPYLVGEQVAKAGVEVWGYSGGIDEESQKSYFKDDDLSIYSKIIYVPPDFPYPDNKQATFKYRNVISTANCDAAVFISGRWGTLNEFTNLTDMKKPAGFLIGTGGIADEMPDLMKKIHKEGQGEVIFNEDPERLIKDLLDLLK